MMGNKTNLKLKQNGLKRKDILHLQKRYPINGLESSAVDIYLRRKGFVNFKNETLLKTVDKCDSKTKIEIENCFLSKDIELNLKNIEKFFELLIAPSERKLNGAYYTPTFLVEYITKKSINGDIRVCDPACGSGSFLVSAVKRLAEITKKSMTEVIENNVFGSDILPSSIRRSKIILSILALENGEDKSKIKFNLDTIDSLDFDWSNKYPEIFNKGGFDTVIGNPPYIRTKNLSEGMRKKIQNWNTARYGNVDLFIPFVELGIKLINDKGILGYVLPNGYTNSFSGIKLREFLQNNRYVKEILDFDNLQLFEDATTYTCITFFDKMPKTSFEYVLIDDVKNIEHLNELKFHSIDFQNLDPKGWKLINEKDSKNIKNIETVGVALSKIAQIKTGIATLRNDLYILVNPRINGKYFLKSFNGKQYKIEKEITREAIHAGTAKTTDQLDNDRRWIIFPYKMIEKKYTIIPEIELKRKYPECYKYFLSIKSELEKRDKGKKKYEAWYAYGRTQGLESFTGRKIVVPTISNKPRFIITNKASGLIYAGYGIYYEGDIDVLAKILNSEVMWYYIKKTSKRYAGGYMSFAKNFIKNFSIPQLSKKEKQFIKTSAKEELDKFLTEKYGIDLCQ